MLRILSTANKGCKNDIGPLQRGSMLGETPLSSTPRSVFDYLSQKDRDRLKNLSSSLASGTVPPQQPPPPPAPIVVPPTDAQTAQAALKGFQPFTTDPAKQARYTAYLQSQASPDAAKIKPMAGQSNENFNKELSDYAKAAQIFKPVSGAMAGRFASASTVEIVGNTHQGLHKPTKDDYARLEGPQEEAIQEEESPKAHAARMGMFGPLTREAKVWQPARLLCRRFGVKDPYPDGVPGEEPPVAASMAKSDAWQAEVMKSAPNLTVPSSSAVASGSTTPPIPHQKGQRDLANVGMGDDDEQGKETLTYERPTKDIFKAIFASDEEDSDEEDTPIDEHEKGVGTSGEGVIKTTAPLETAKIYQQPASQSNPTVTVDLTSFRPTFVPKSEREERKKLKDRDKKEKKDKDKKKKGKMVVSFDVEDESGDRVKAAKEKKDRPRKRQKDKSQPDADDDSMWVERPPPEVVRELVIPVSMEAEERDDHPHPRGRKRAVDFL
jgi:G patch domain-containing protein 1